MSLSVQDHGLIRSDSAWLATRLIIPPECPTFWVRPAFAEGPSPPTTPIRFLTPGIFTRIPQPNVHKHTTTTNGACEIMKQTLFGTKYRYRATTLQSWYKMATEFLSFFKFLACVLVYFECWASSKLLKMFENVWKCLKIFENICFFNCLKIL